MITKIILEKSIETKVIFPQKEAKTAPQNKVNCFFLVFANKRNVNSGGVRRGRVSGCGCWPL